MPTPAALALSRVRPVHDLLAAGPPQAGAAGGGTTVREANVPLGVEPLGGIYTSRSEDWMRLTPAPSMSFHALASDPSASIPRVASSIT